MSQHISHQEKVADTDSPKMFKYVCGYVFSICLTIEAYILVVRHTLSDNAIIAAIIGLALLQFVVQLVYFLHLGFNAKSRWKLLVLAFMLMVVSILVFGTLWIMTNLNYRMTPQQINTYMSNQGGF